MTDLPSSLGIEAVECLGEGGRSLTVRVTGRWRRRRPELRGQPMLVVETDSGRQRFLAMPEPPSLTGAAPGTWRMSFSVPLELAPELPGRAFLQIGGVMVPLPIGELALGPLGRPEPDVLEARRARGSELAAESARRRAAELAADVERLERELADAREQSTGLREAVRERERRLRVADQHTHAERALRSEIEQELTLRSRAARHEKRALHERVADLERELGRMRRAVDEAGHLAAAAEAARAKAERRLAERAPPPLSLPETPQVAPAAPPPPSPAAPGNERAEQIRREAALRRTSLGSPPAGATARPVERAGDRTAIDRESVIAATRHVSRSREDVERLAVLERELAAAREEAEVQRRRSARAYEAIELVRGELGRLRMASAQRAAPPPAPREAVELAGPPAPSEPVQAERLTEALARLRERTPPVELNPPEAPAVEPDPAEPTSSVAVDQSGPARATKPWLDAAFRRLTAEDASAAGRLVLALLPAQRAADPQPVAYDLILSDVLVAHVTVDSLSMHVHHDATPRPPSEVDLQLVGDLASMARLLRAGRLRRRVRLPPGRLARVRGDRRRLAALDRLIDARLAVGELHAAGVKLDPLMAFTLAGLMLEPAWTAGERFTIGHRELSAANPDAYLHVRDGRPSLATAEPPHGPVASVLVSGANEVLAALAGTTAAQVVGEQRPLMLLRQWLDRAQSG